MSEACIEWGMKKFIDFVKTYILFDKKYDVEFFYDILLISKSLL